MDGPTLLNLFDIPTLSCLYFTPDYFPQLLIRREKQYMFVAHQSNFKSHTHQLRRNRFVVLSLEYVCPQSIAIGKHECRRRRRRRRRRLSISSWDYVTTLFEYNDSPSSSLFLR